MRYSALTVTCVELVARELNNQVAIYRLSVSQPWCPFLAVCHLVLLTIMAAACLSEPSPTVPATSSPATSKSVPAATPQTTLAETPSPTATKATTVSSAQTPSPAAALTPTPAATLPSLRPAEVPLSDLALGFVTELVEDLGPRESATEQELEAAQYLASRLEGFGYTVDLQNFTIQRLSAQLSSLEIHAPQPQAIDVIPLVRSATGEVSGELIAVGLARERDVPEDGLVGKIVLAERGLITFQEKVTRAAESGAVAVVIYNNLPGNFQGVLLNTESIPAVGISQEDGRRMERLLSAAAVQVSVSVIARTDTSRNVIAEKPGLGNRVVVLGAHYDTVADISGANDNASGTGVLLTLAGELATEDLPFTVRFVAFGSEELGLRGSNHYVASLTEIQLNNTKVMFNFDALGTGERVEVLGTRDLTALAVEQGDAQKIDISVTRGLEGGGSDHQSFADAGIPVLMFFSGDFSRIHTPADTLEFVTPSLLGDAAQVALSLLKSEDFLRVLK